MEFFMNMEYWHWLAIGLVLLTLEMFAPGAILLWFGVAGIVVGVLQLIFGDLIGPQVQWLLFSIFSIVSIVAWKSYAKKHKIGVRDENDTLNQRGKALIGKEFVLSTAIVNGVGKAKVGDTHWRVIGSDMEINQRVKVVGFEGASLKVEAL
ncbi:NfeD family protein [Kangiella sp. HZ709]|uniref:NfeD family protein n=1 Tax=Kangiella sp. HZ709 TaxID=2666328 RepID=UPI0012AF140F|nr:NfeD family protein [Kangiella sp. HZ709]MRX28233.1 NfeD family protein [Kangiella sp. HZ709]